jgi:hypothetical protein
LATAFFATVFFATAGVAVAAAGWAAVDRSVVVATCHGSSSTVELRVGSIVDVARAAALAASAALRRSDSQNSSPSLGGSGVSSRPVRCESVRRIAVTPAARSPTPAASLSAISGAGSRMAAMVRHTGQTQHSGLSVAKPEPGRAADPRPRVA